MKAELLALARGFAACPKWTWLPGMLALPENYRQADRVRVAVGGAWWTDSGRRVTNDIPDLDDELTRAGIAVVVRKAHGGRRYIEVRRLDDSLIWQCTVAGEHFQSDTSNDGDLLALLIALEAA